MQKFVVTEPDFGISEFDTHLGQMWSDHCIAPFFNVIIRNDDMVFLYGKNGEFKGKTTVELLTSMGEEC